MALSPFSGVVTALVTPFDSSNQLDLKAFERILVAQKNAGIHGVIVGGTTGESPTLSDAELLQLTQLALKHRSPEFLVYVGTGTNSTQGTLQKSRFIQEALGTLGLAVDGFMAVVPYYNKPSQTGLIEHFVTLAQALGHAPLCVYNVPGRTVANLLPQTFVQIAQRAPNVVALKEAAGDLKALTSVCLALEKAGLRGRVRVLSGDDLTFLPSLISGADGVISVASHIAPWAFVEALQAYQDNQLQKLRLLQSQLFSLSRDLFCAPNPVPVKFLLSHLGFCLPQVRLPLVPLDESETPILWAVLADLKRNCVRILGS